MPSSEACPRGVAAGHLAPALLGRRRCAQPALAAPPEQAPEGRRAGSCSALLGTGVAPLCLTAQTQDAGRRGGLEACPDGAQTGSSTWTGTATSGELPRSLRRPRRAWLQVRPLEETGRPPEETGPQRGRCCMGTRSPRGDLPGACGARTPAAAGRPGACVARCGKVTPAAVPSSHALADDLAGPGVRHLPV